ncbi:hypothetical protein MFIFM68171_04847 [Madurella fahalii]|uniref:Membrane insertase YidC/Oxa/ALB C-terminal domain-containing protein n=1 Tax=Madurella fahalii TaxID=1157608 RepID=A0ABQ0GA60_9PEZI
MMLPSRGLLRSSPSLGLAKAAFQKPSTRALSRQFGTALRGNNATVLRRTGSPLVLTAASRTFVSPLRQARYASTQPAPLPDAAPADASTLAEVTATPVSLTGSDLLDIPEQIGFLKTLGLDYGWGPTSLMQTLLESTYVYTGLPWWASIGLVALAVRLALLKPTLDASENAQKLQDLQKDPRYAAATDHMKKSLLSGNHLAGAEARHKVSLMNKEAGYKPWKNLIGLIQIPIGIGMFRLIKGMAALPVPSFETGGFLWFTDLTVSDPYFLLPILTGIVFTNAMRLPLPYMAPQQQKIMKIMTVVMLPLSTVVAIFLPAGVQLYFFATSALHFLQSFVTHQPWFRRWVGLRPLVKPSTALPGGITWEAPRVVDVQAPRVKTDRPVAAPKSENMYESFQSSLGTIKEKFNEYADRKSGDRDHKIAREYEEKRALEEKERLIARLQGKRARDNGRQ